MCGQGRAPGCVLGRSGASLEEGLERRPEARGQGRGRLSCGLGGREERWVGHSEGASGGRGAGGGGKAEGQGHPWEGAADCMVALQER